MPNEDLVFYVKLYVRPDRVDEWKEAVHAVIEAMSKEDAFISCDLHQDAHDAHLFTLYERWAEPSVEAFLKNQMKPYRVAYESRLEALLQRPREPQVLKPLAQWRRHGQAGS
ncbi:antibiotic biosynthesis monooxygenase [Pusillimonas sp. SM2304]|uniref:putative quinol monooxygenase n=1 Tax=Pusillimonas sp. SM2304 TaxID=3073241 RepID=UPI00287482CF|nr:antibiotic biosynthesis monooxygenase [Pusillimonas sp. SM2304]MDS1140467.1 antibiotic biosynthesis monooxygenase [Pusillimonas sp. SM2304]